MLVPFLGRVGPPKAPGWAGTDSPRKLLHENGVETQIRALGTRFVAMFRIARATFEDSSRTFSLSRTPLRGALPRFVWDDVRRPRVDSPLSSSDDASADVFEFLSTAFIK